MSADLFDCNSWLIFIMYTSWSGGNGVSRAFENADGPCQPLVAKKSASHPVDQLVMSA